MGNPSIVGMILWFLFLTSKEADNVGDHMKVACAPRGDGNGPFFDHCGWQVQFVDVEWRGGEVCSKVKYLRPFEYIILLLVHYFIFP